MAMWHCPHCGAPQAETARCWVCRRSSTTCSTCRHFRASLATEVGYCALDRRRRPLTGTELRGCWAERPATGAEAASGKGPSTAAAGTARITEPGLRLRQPAREFIPVELVSTERRPIAPATEADAAVSLPSILPADAATTWDVPTSLFGDAER